MIFVIVTLGLVALLFVLLCIPLKIELSGSFQPRYFLRVRLIYLFGLISWDLHRARDQADRQVDELHKPEKRSLYLSQVWELSQIEGLVEAVGSLVADLMHRIKAGRIETDLRISLGDDYYTGMLFACLIPLTLYTQQPPKYDVNLQPAFEDELLLEGSIYGTWQVRPLKVLEPFLNFAFSRPAWRAGRKLISYRCSKKN